MRNHDELYLQFTARWLLPLLLVVALHEAPLLPK